MAFGWERSTRMISVLCFAGYLPRASVNGRWLCFDRHSTGAGPIYHGCYEAIKCFVVAEVEECAVSANTFNDLVLHLKVSVQYA